MVPHPHRILGAIFRPFRMDLGGCSIELGERVVRAVVRQYMTNADSLPCLISNRRRYIVVDVSFCGKGVSIARYRVRINSQRLRPSYDMRFDDHMWIFQHRLGYSGVDCSPKNVCEYDMHHMC